MFLQTTCDRKFCKLSTSFRVNFISRADLYDHAKTGQVISITPTRPPTPTRKSYQYLVSLGRNSVASNSPEQRLLPQVLPPHITSINMSYSSSAFSPCSSPELSSECYDNDMRRKRSSIKEISESGFVERPAASAQLNLSKQSSNHQCYDDRNGTAILDLKRLSRSPHSESGTVNTLCEPTIPLGQSLGDFGPLSASQIQYSWPSRMSSLYHDSLDSADLSCPRPHASYKSNRASSSTTTAISGPLSTRSSIDPAFTCFSQTTCWDSISNSDYYPSRTTPHPPEKEPQSIFDVDTDDESCEETVFTRLTTSLRLSNNSQRAASTKRRWRCLSNPCKQILQCLPCAAHGSSTKKL